MNEMKTVFFGGSGKMGREFLRQFPQTIAPSHKDVDITDYDQVSSFITSERPDLVIHAAAIIGMKESQIKPEKTYQVNVTGTENVAKSCLEHNARLVYISSVSVFDGEKGFYSEKDIPHPSYYYGWTKLLGEQSVKMGNNFVIVRTDFFEPGAFKYSTIMNDHYSSKIPVGKLVKRVHAVAHSIFTGIIHIGGPREPLFDILSPYQPDAIPINIKDSSMPEFPQDLSLNTTLFDQLFPQLKSE